jgi:anti-sigma B factor antagonist
MTPSPGLEIRVASGAHYTTITAVGDIDLATSPGLRAPLRQAVEQAPTIVELADVTFLDSSGLRVLAEAHRHAATHSTALRIAAPSEAVLHVFRIAAPDIFDTYPDTATAIAATTAQPA